MDALDSIGTSVSGIADSIVTAIESFFEYLFVPDTERFELEFRELRSSYGFVDSIVETGEALGSVFSRATMDEQEPPVIYADFGAAESEYNWGGKVKILDLSWYEDYKPTVDTVLGAILWVFFIWRIYVRLPSIISGGSGIVKLGSRLGGNDDI